MQRLASLEVIINIFTRYLRPWTQHHYYSQYPNLFLWTPVFCGFGISLYFKMTSEPPISVPVIGSFVLYALYSVLIKPAKIEALSLAFIAFIFIFAGFSAATIRSYQVIAPILTKNTKAVNVIGTIESIELLEEQRGARITLTDLEIENIKPENTPRKIRLTLRQHHSIEHNDKIKALAKLNTPSAPLHPEGFNFRRYLFFQEIGATGFIYTKPEILEHAHSRKFSFEKMRYDLAQHFSKNMDKSQSGFAIALTTGFKHLISEEDYQIIRDAGLAHMLAISGLHISLICGCVFFIIRLVLTFIPYIALNLPIKSIAAVAAIMAGVFYMHMAGATAPTQRAVIMSTIFFVAIILHRSAISLRLVAIAALAILLYRPESLISVSFQMSFAAVTALIYFYDKTRNFWQRAYQRQGVFQKFSLYFLSLCLTTLIASIATAPIALYHFGQISAIGSVANFFAVPILSLWIMPAALAALITMPADYDAIFLMLMGKGIDAILALASWASALPHATYSAAQMPQSSFILFILSALCIIVIKGREKIMLSGVLLGLSVYQIHAHKTASILISDTHKIFALINPEDEQLYASRTNKERFVLDSWQIYLGTPADQVHKLEKLAHCDEEGCRIQFNRYKISYIKTPYILKTECHWADIIISDKPVDKTICRGKIIIDKYDTHQNGYYALWLDSNEIRVKNSSNAEKNRPWSLFPRYPNKS